MEVTDMIKTVRDQARRQASQFSPTPHHDPWDFMRSIEFPDLADDGGKTQEEVAEQVLDLSPSNCLGRTAILGSLFEQHFPTAPLVFGEVRQDYFRNLLMGHLAEKSGDPSFLQELVMYEEPHNVPILNGVQCELLSIAFGKRVVHPDVIMMPFWAGVTACWMVSQAFFLEPALRLRTLAAAERLCPGLAVVAENTVSTLYALGKTQEALSLATECLKWRPTARTLYFLYAATGNDHWAKKLSETYTPAMLTYFQEGGDV